jgi:GR25 family glycosyltransferase involved in LPS biosynthesis
MKSHVITIRNNKLSEQAAERCIRSMPEFNVKTFDAVTPESKPLEILKIESIPVSAFQEKYSYLESCVAAFLSHYSLWKQCAADKEEFQIFEHDAVRVGELPEFINYDRVISLGKPSYGNFNTPRTLGTNPLCSKRYFPGAHAYRLKPAGAKELIERAKVDGGPTDVFLHLDKFPWLQEYYPWPVIAKDSFTTIQKTEGCLAKHNYHDGVGYEIVR